MAHRSDATEARDAEQAIERVLREERDAAAAVAERALSHRVFGAARAAAAAGRPCRREAPITIRDGETLIDGQIDLAFDDGDSWVVVDFKTDAELGESEGVYRRQIALYAGAPFAASLNGTRAFSAGNWKRPM